MARRTDEWYMREHTHTYTHTRIRSTKETARVRFGEPLNGGSELITTGAAYGLCAYTRVSTTVQLCTCPTPVCMSGGTLRRAVVN